MSTFIPLLYEAQYMHPVIGMSHSVRLSMLFFSQLKARWKIYLPSIASLYVNYPRPHGDMANVRRQVMADTLYRQRTGGVQENLRGCYLWELLKRDATRLLSATVEIVKCRKGQGQQTSAARPESSRQSSFSLVPCENDIRLLIAPLDAWMNVSMMQGSKSALIESIARRLCILCKMSAHKGHHSVQGLRRS